MVKTVEVYVHGSRELLLDKGLAIGLSGEALSMFLDATDEFKLTFEVDTETGSTKTVAVDEVPLKPINGYAIFDILERLYESGHSTLKSGGVWWLLDKDSEGVISGETFRGLCVNIVLAGL